MKNKYILFILLLTSSISFGQAEDWEFLPPFNFQVDSISLLATWEAPKIVLLDEDFEGDAFPPEGWTASSLGVGWLCEENPPYHAWWMVPVHTGKFALVNDDYIPTNDGSMDFLYTPGLDLTVADSFMLYFDSYFDGAYGQTAYVKYSVDNGATWLLLKQMGPSLEWQREEIDLSGFSGPDGTSNFILTFYTNDRPDGLGWWGSGWAVDNVVVYSTQNPNPVSAYSIFLDSAEIAQVNTTSYQYDFEYSQTHDCGIRTIYQAGFSDTIWQDVRSFYLPKPDSLTGFAPDDAVILMWEPPAGNEYLLGYNIYRNDSLIGSIESNDTVCCGYVDPVIDWQGESPPLSYEVSALYDLSEYGIAGDTGESLREGPADVYLPLIYTVLDLFEDFSSGSIDYYEWPVIDSNWAIDLSMGNNAPCLVFQPNTLLLNYEQFFKSCLIFTHLAGDVILEYDILLSSANPSDNERLLVQVYDYPGNSWNTVKSITSAEGSFGWRHDSLDITPYFNENYFKIRFDAQGENSGDIIYWAIDNISIRNECYHPRNIQAVLKPPSVDSVLITWEKPFPDVDEWKQWDDGVHFNSIGFGTSKNSWFSIAVRWTPELLADLKDASITAVGFIPGDVSASFKIALWSGDNLTPFYTQAAGNLIAYQYNIFQLDTPQKIDITKDLYIGYRLSTYCDYPISVDNGPAIDSLGNMFRYGSGGPWTTLLAINPEFNWNLNIKAYFERDGIPADSYQLYRSLDGNEAELIADIESLEYTDTVSSGFITSCYKVKSIFDYGCTSDFSEEQCVVFTNADEDNLDEAKILNIYPNPASDVLFIESKEKIESIIIFDSRGITIEQWNNGTMEQWNSGTLKIPVSDLAPGLYLVKVETVNGTVAKKVVVGR